MAQANRYLEKLASGKAIGGLRKIFKEGWSDANPSTKLSIGLGLTGTGMSAAGLINSTSNSVSNHTRNGLEQRSINELGKIRKAIEAPSTPAQAPIIKITAPAIREILDQKRAA